MPMLRFFTFMRCFLEFACAFIILCFVAVTFRFVCGLILPTVDQGEISKRKAHIILQKAEIGF